MITVTTKEGSTRSDLLMLHEQFMEYMQTRATVQHAVVEKSNIWHIHYVVNYKSTHVKNLQRDLKKTLNTIVDVARKVTSLKRFNGMCKYVLKREYIEKGGTHIDTLIDGITYVPKKGYILTPDPEKNLSSP